MLKYAHYGTIVHISNNGLKTICGIPCVASLTQTEAIDWNGSKTDCPQCGTPEAFKIERDYLAMLLQEVATTEDYIRRERAEMLKRRVEASNMVDDNLKAMMASAGITYYSGSYASDSITFRANLSANGVDFHMTIKVTF